MKYLKNMNGVSLISLTKYIYTYLLHGAESFLRS